MHLGWCILHTFITTYLWGCILTDPETKTSPVIRVLSYQSNQPQSFTCASCKDLAFFQDLQCSPESLVPVLSWVLEYIGSRGPSQQIAVNPSRAFDEEGTGTTWIGNCLDCNASDEGPWVGVVLQHEVLPVQKPISCWREKGERHVAMPLTFAPACYRDSSPACHRIAKSSKYRKVLSMPKFLFVMFVLCQLLVAMAIHVYLHQSRCLCNVFV